MITGFQFWIQRFLSLSICGGCRRRLISFSPRAARAIRQPWAIVLERSALLLLLLDRAEMSNMIGADLNLSEIELPSNVACKETFNRLLSQNALW
jgi:hypothetical protein